MKFWSEIAQAKNAVVIHLIEVPESLSHLIGLTAFTSQDFCDPQGPLTKKEFWPEHWAILQQQKFSKNDLSLSPAPGFRYLIYKIEPEAKALILGGGHVGQALAQVLLFLDYEILIFDDREEFATYCPRYPDEKKPDKFRALCAPFSELLPLVQKENFAAVVIVTRGHFSDLSVLRQLLTLEQIPPYLGMIGSRKRAAECLNLLAREGFPPEILAKIHSPIGLPIAAETPEEIAISIAGQMILEKRQ